MDQGSYLSQALWQYRHHSLYTDLTIITSDGSLPTHAAMLAGLFTSFGITFPTREEVAECLFLPNLTKAQVEDALKMVYMGHKHDVLTSKLKGINNVIKTELSDYAEEMEVKVAVDDNNFDDSDQPEVDETDSDEDYKPPKPKLVEDIKSVPKLVEDITSVDIKDIKVYTKVTSCDADMMQTIDDLSCDLCGYSTSVVSHFKRHKKIHTGEKTVLPRAKRKEQDKKKVTYNKGGKCPYCKKDLKDITLHLALAHREEALQNHPEIEFDTPCQDCDLMFFSVVDLDKHTGKVHGKPSRDWRCRICFNSFLSKFHLANHRQTAHAEELEAMGYKGVGKNNECPYCDIKSKRPSDVQNHIFNRHKDKRELHPEIKANHKCDYCEEVFCGFTYKKNHMEKDHSEFCMSQCQLCPKSFKQNSALRDHIDREHDDTVHICDVCSREFPTRVYLKRHLRKHDETYVKKFKFPCKLCKTGKYQNEENLQNHILEEHSGKEHICSECPASFTNVMGLRIHEKRLHAEKTLKCDYCDMMFYGQWIKNDHMKMKHIKAKDKICPHCGEAFEHQPTFDAHVKRHTDDRQYSCEECGKAFLTQDHLKAHMNTHTLPFTCKMCPKGFSVDIYLQDHIRKAHDGVELTCRWGCGWKSMTKGLVTKHETKKCDLNPFPGKPYCKPGQKTREQGFC